MGRLFDAISSLAGIRHQINYEAHAAIELEALVDHDETDVYPFELSIDQDSDTGIIDPHETIKAVKKDSLSNIRKSIIAARFHNTVAEMVHQTSQFIRDQSGIETIVLSGGVWQNITLLQKVIALLTNDHFSVYTHNQVPSNDGGLALGQVVIAARNAQLEISWRRYVFRNPRQNNRNI